MEFGIYKIIDESINEYIADNVLNESGDLLMEKKRKRKKKKKPNKQSRDERAGREDRPNKEEKQNKEEK